jgi:peroxiredoxin
MKSIVLLVCSLLFCYNLSQAQVVKTKLDENTIVMDSSGYVYPYGIWTKLMQSGKYSLRSINPKEPAKGFVLRELTPEEMKRRDANAAKPKETDYFVTGKKLSDFKLKDMQGTKYRLSDLKGKVVVLNFWFINCPPCKQEIPELNKVVDDYKNKEVLFLAIALDEYRELSHFLSETSFHYKIVDGGRWFAQNHGVKAYPTHLVLDKEGKVVYHTSGLSTGTIPWLRKTIDGLLTN